jgi:hypothetical protein
LIILSATFFLEIVLVVISIINPPKPIAVHLGALESIKHQYAETVLQRDTLPEGNLLQFPDKALTADAGVGAPSGATLELDQTQTLGSDASQTAEGSGPDGGSAQPTRTGDTQTSARGGGVLTSRSDRAAGGQAVESQVSSEGILGLFNSSRSSGKDQTLNEVLKEDVETSGAALERSMARARSGSGGPGTGASGSGSGRATTDVRGGRATTTGSIDDRVSGPGGGIGGSGLKKQTDLMQMDLTPLTSSEDSQSAIKDAIKLGGRDPNLVASVVFGHSAAIQYCYERELQRNPELKGKVSVRFTILPDGNVSNPAVISSTLDNERVERCILSRISRWDDFGAIDSALGNATFRQVYTFGY